MSATPAQTERDLAECEHEAAKVSGYDWIDAAFRRAEVKNACMRLRGYWHPG